MSILSDKGVDLLRVGQPEYNFSTDVLGIGATATLLAGRAGHKILVYFMHVDDAGTATTITIQSNAAARLVSDDSNKPRTWEADRGFLLLESGEDLRLTTSAAATVGSTFVTQYIPD